MFLSFKSDLNDLFKDLGKFIDNNDYEPFLWVLIFCVLFVIALYGISKFGNK